MASPKRILMRYLVTLIILVAVVSGCRKQSSVSNSTTLTDEQFNLFISQRNKVLEAYESDSSKNAVDKLERGARVLQKDYPTENSGYQLMMMAMADRETSSLAKARALAQEMIAGSAPDNFKQWAKGFLHRLDCMGKPVAIQFVATDGREAGLASMRGKVVLVDFWATWCGPCVAEIPRVKAAFERFHAKGFEVIGISCDTDEDKLAKFVEEQAISWPQFFDGSSQIDNKFSQAFGINGIPHMFLVDKKGCLRVDNVRAKGDFEEQIAKLLVEQ